MFRGKLWSIAQLIPLDGELDKCSVKAEQCYHSHYQTAENHKAYAWSIARIFAEYVTLTSKNPYPTKVYSLAN